MLVLGALNLVGTLLTPGSTFAAKATTLVPKLGLDLEGGTQIILAPQLTSGSKATADELNQSVGIIRQRVNAAGVSEAQVSQSNGTNIIVSLPGTPSRATINSVKQSARMDFRAVLVTAASTSSTVGKSGAGFTPPASLGTVPSIKPTSGSDLNQVTPYLQSLYTNYRCGQDDNRTTAPDPRKPLVTCDPGGNAKYLLGPVEVEGQHIKTASSGIEQSSQGVSTGRWQVNLSFDPVGTREFAAVTQRLSGLTGARNQFAIVLDNKVIEAPGVDASIPTGVAQITGGFTQDSAKSLADQLAFGALPISFTVQSQNTVSATLGSQQLLSGLIAGLIGLVLVILYSLLQYRTLGLVTIASLAISALLTYLVIDFLSWRQGYRLSLAGVAGLIVSIGITADSFIVYFERIRDELREGRGLTGAVEAGWRRAVRTVLASDSVNFLAAAVLFLLAVGDVKGFALTLGITTLIDVVVVALFTHPVLQLLSRVSFFAEGHRASGLDPRALGAVYRGRGHFREPALSGAGVGIARSRSEAQRRQTIAERKAGGSAVAAVRAGDFKGDMTEGKR